MAADAKEDDGTNDPTSSGDWASDLAARLFLSVCVWLGGGVVWAARWLLCPLLPWFPWLATGVLDAVLWTAGAPFAFYPKLEYEQLETEDETRHVLTVRLRRWLDWAPEA